MQCYRIIFGIWDEQDKMLCFMNAKAVTILYYGLNVDELIRYQLVNMLKTYGSPLSKIQMGFHQKERDGKNA